MLISPLMLTSSLPSCHPARSCYALNCLPCSTSHHLRCLASPFPPLALQYALRKLYHESPRVVGVLYTSPTCGPCRTLKPMLSKVVDEFSERLHWVEIDITEDPEIAEAAGIMGTPVVHFFKSKERVG